MKLLRRFRGLTARAASRLGPEPLRHTVWARRARIGLYVFATILLVWEISTIGPDDSLLQTIARLLTVATLYVLGHWPTFAAFISLPLLILKYAPGYHEQSLAIFVPIAVAGVLIAVRSRAIGYIYVLAVAATLASVDRSENPLRDFFTWLLTLLLVAGVPGEIVRYVLTSIQRLRQTTDRHLRQQRRELARELHDTSIHDITAIIMALERAKLAGIDDASVAEEIDRAIATGRQSVVSMRGVLKFLRSAELSIDGSPPPPEIASTLPNVRQVLEDARTVLDRVGLGVQIHVEDQVDLPMPFSVRTALVRVIQEATTNMAKYGKQGTTGTVMVERTDTETRALFVNDVAEDASGDDATSSKLGLLGVRERVEAVGGTATMRHHDGRWMLQVSIPTIGSVSEGQVERARQH